MKHYDGQTERGQVMKTGETKKTEEAAAVQTPAPAKDTLATGQCNCGCGAPCGNLFCPGHDSRVYSLLRKYNAGEADVASLDHLPPGVKDRFIGSPHAQPVEKAKKAPAKEEVAVA